MNTASIDLGLWQRGRQLPQPTALTRPFWAGLQEGKLLVQRCSACGQHVFRPEIACTRCLSLALDWVESSGLGVVYSYSVVRRPPRPDIDTPYVVGVVKLEEGWHMMTNLVGLPPEEVRSGMPVVLRVGRIGQTAVPLFVPRGDSTTAAHGGVAVATFSG